jgi:hypothetical protein
LQVMVGAGVPVAVTLSWTEAEHRPCVAFTSMLFGQVMVGGIPTAMSADAALPVPPLVDVTLPGSDILWLGTL